MEVDAVFLAALSFIPTTFLEVVAVELSLYLVVSFVHVELEPSLGICLQCFSCGVVHLMAVHLEMYAGNRDVRAAIDHLAGELVAGDNDEIRKLRIVCLAVKFCCVARVGLSQIHSRRPHAVGDGVLIVITQLIDFVVSFVVCGQIDFLAVGRHNHGDSCQSSTVWIAHIAFELTCVLAGTFHDFRLIVVHALAVDGGTHLVFIIHDWGDGGVFVTQVHDAGFHGFPFAVVSTFRTAHHLEEVDDPAFSFPCQHHAALAGFGDERIAFHLTA